VTPVSSDDAAVSDSGSVVVLDAQDSPADSGSDSASKGDLDGDGLDDADEQLWASQYYPFYAIHPSDGCKTHGVVFRLSPHPKNAGRITIWYDVLYDDDCGGAGHAGDDEVFGVVADPARAGADGILAVRAISHQGTPCERTTTCGKCQGMSTCSTELRNGAKYPVVYASKDKHGSYTDKGTCDSSFICDFGGCGIATPADAPPLVNAGEPGKPLMSDLTTQGFITAQNGWKNMALFHFDPWKPGKFGGAGDVSKDLVDPAFVIDSSMCP
jgi:hypothetical protein